MTFRFLHTADLHLDTPFSGLGKIAPEWAARLRDTSLKVFDAVVELAIQREVAFVVIAGDIYDGEARGLRAQLRFREGLLRLSKAGIPALVSHGNHDPEGGRWSAIGGWPEGVTIFPSDQALSVPILKDGVPIATVTGRSFRTPRELSNLALTFPPPAGPGFQVAVLHASVGTSSDHAPYSPCSVDDLRGAGYDYWALGHIHDHRVVCQAPYVVYPGTPQGRSFATTERGPKSVSLVTVSNGRVIELDTPCLDEIRFYALTQEVSEMTHLETVADAVLAQVSALSDARGLVVSVSLTGRSELASLLAEAVHQEELLAALRDQAPPGVLIARLESQVHAPLDRARLARGNDLRAALLAEAARLAEGGALGAALRPAFGERPLGLPDEALPELLEEALDLLLSNLSQENL